MSEAEGELEEEALDSEFEEEFDQLKNKWKNELRKNKKLLLKCPNYEVHSTGSLSMCVHTEWRAYCLFKSRSSGTVE